MRRSRTWLWIGGGILAMVFIPPFWIWLLHVTGTSFSASTDPTTLLTLLATIMGGIFVAGGLLVLLGSIISASDVERRVKIAATDEGKRIEENTYRHVDTFYRLVQARELSDWRDAVESTEAILDNQPEVPQAYYLLGERLFRDIEEHFVSRRETGNLLQPRIQIEDLEGLYSRAAGYLTEATRRRQGPPGRAAALHALVAGLQESIRAVLGSLAKRQDERTTVELQGRFLKEPAHVAMLARACKNQSHLEALGQLLGIQLPIPIQDVRSNVNEIDGQLSRSEAWWVWALPEKWGTPPQLFPRWLYLWIEKGDDSAPPTLHGRLNVGRVPGIPPDLVGQDPLSDATLDALQFLIKA